MVRETRIIVAKGYLCALKVSIYKICCLHPDLNPVDIMYSFDVLQGILSFLRMQEWRCSAEFKMSVDTSRASRAGRFHSLEYLGIAIA